MHVTAKRLIATATFVEGNRRTHKTSNARIPALHGAVEGSGFGVVEGDGSAAAVTAIDWDRGLFRPKRARGPNRNPRQQHGGPGRVLLDCRFGRNVYGRHPICSARLGPARHQPGRAAVVCLRRCPHRPATRSDNGTGCIWVHLFLCRQKRPSSSSAGTPGAPLLSVATSSIYASPAPLAVALFGANCMFEKIQPVCSASQPRGFFSLSPRRGPPLSATPSSAI